MKVNSLLKIKRFNVYDYNSILIIKGPLGCIPLNLPIFEWIDNKRFFFYKADVKTIEGLIWQITLGLCYGYFIELVLKGLGYRIWRYENYIFFELGYNHRIVLKAPSSLIIKSRKSRIVLFSCYKDLLSYWAYQIKTFRWVDSYKGKGFRFSTDIIKLKPGKQR